MHRQKAWKKTETDVETNREMEKSRQSIHDVNEGVRIAYANREGE